MFKSMIEQKGQLIWGGLGLVILAWIFLYWGNFPVLWGHWDNEDSNYCMLIPVLFAYLVYHNKDFIWKQIGSAIR